jgi:hypothetical protein
MDAAEVQAAKAYIQTGIVGSTNDGTLAMLAVP